MSLISRFLYKGTFGAKPKGRNLARKIVKGVQGGTVAQSHSTHKPPAQVEAISYSITLKWRQSPTQLLSSGGNPSRTLYEIPYIS